MKIIVTLFVILAVSGQTLADITCYGYSIADTFPECCDSKGANCAFTGCNCGKSGPYTGCKCTGAAGSKLPVQTPVQDSTTSVSSNSSMTTTETSSSDMPSSTATEGIITIFGASPQPLSDLTVDGKAFDEVCPKCCITTSNGLSCYVGSLDGLDTCDCGKMPASTTSSSPEMSSSSPEMASPSPAPSSAGIIFSSAVCIAVTFAATLMTI